MKIILLSIILPVALNAASLNVLEGKWNGKCRPVVNEAGEIIKKDSSLQSSYTFQKGIGLVWQVSSFKDSTCRTIKDANRSTFQCDKKTSICIQVKRESTQDGEIWTTKKMVDHAGYSSIMKSKITVKKINSSIQINITDVKFGESSQEILNKKK